MAAMDDLNALLSGLPGYSKLTDTMKQAALDGALIPDSAGVWPGQDGYVNTYDVYYAAYNLLGFLQAQPVIRQSSSEGTSVAQDAPNWDGLRTYYRGMSPICQATSSGPLTKVLIPDGPHVAHTNMRGVGGYGDVDTDIS